MGMEDWKVSGYVDQELGANMGIQGECGRDGLRHDVRRRVVVDHGPFHPRWYTAVVEGTARRRSVGPAPPAEQSCRR